MPDDVPKVTAAAARSSTTVVAPDDVATPLIGIVRQSKSDGSVTQTGSLGTPIGTAAAVSPTLRRPVRPLDPRIGSVTGGAARRRLTRSRGCLRRASSGRRRCRGGGTARGRRLCGGGGRCRRSCRWSSGGAGGTRLRASGRDSRRRDRVTGDAGRRRDRVTGDAGRIRLSPWAVRLRLSARHLRPGDGAAGKSGDDAEAVGNCSTGARDPDTEAQASRRQFGLGIRARTPYRPGIASRLGRGRARPSWWRGRRPSEGATGGSPGRCDRAGSRPGAPSVDRRNGDEQCGGCNEARQQGYPDLDWTRPRAPVTLAQQHPGQRREHGGHGDPSEQDGHESPEHGKVFAARRGIPGAVRAFRALSVVELGRFARFARSGRADHEVLWGAWPAFSLTARPPPKNPQGPGGRYVSRTISPMSAPPCSTGSM